MEINANRLLIPSGWDRAFTMLLNDPQYPTQESAYEALEHIYVNSFGRRRYSNFQSYRKARSRRLQREKP